MFAVKACSLPPQALLRRYQDSGEYTDCYRTTVRGRFDLAQFVRAFYTTPIFRLERLVLRWLVGRGSSDAAAERLANDDSDEFAAWRVEARGSDQLLLCDYLGRTRSWLMTAPAQNGDTALYFGSAIVRRRYPRGGASQPGLLLRPLIGFHRLYSRILLAAARTRLESCPPRTV